MIKSVSLLVRKAGMSRIEIHAPLALAVPGLRRYVQSHILEDRKRPDVPPLDVEIDGIAELWYDSLEDMQFANASPQAKRLHEDGATFIGRIKSYTIEERLIVPGPNDRV